MCAQYLAGGYFVWPNMRYANVGGYLLHPPSKQQCVELPSELLDRNQGNDMVY